MSTQHTHPPVASDDGAASSEASGIAVVVPPANPTVAAEIGGWLPGLTLQVEPLPTLDGDLAARLAGYAERIDEPVERLRSRGVAAALVACTGCSYRLGVPGDRVLAEDASRRLGAPVVTAAGAVAGVLEQLGATSMTLVSPYPDWLTAQSAAYWTAVGVRVDQVQQIPGTGAIYDLDDAAVLTALDLALEMALEARAARRDRDDPGHVVLISGTGAPTRGPLDERAAAADVAILSSNLAGAWCLLDLLGRTDLALSSASPALALLAGRLAVTHAAGRRR